MRGLCYVTLDELGNGSSLEVELSYTYETGDRMILTYPDGNYPGSPPDAEFLSAHVLSWGCGSEERQREKGWQWEALDAIAAARIQERWDEFRLACLEDATERINDREDA